MAYQRQQELQKQLGPGDLLVVVHDFDARSVDELTLRRGERIELVEMDDGFGDGWYLGRHSGREQTGLFPGVYTTKVPIALANPQFGGASQRSSLPSPSSTYQASPVSPISHHSMQSPTPSSSFASFQHHDSLNDSDISSRATSYTTIQAPASRSASSMHSSTYSPAMQRSIGQALSGPQTSEDSPVMNETLSVIAEHMQDLSTPRNNGPVHELSATNDSESEYSSHVDRRPSQLVESETDDGEEKLTADQVRYWDHKQTADHLRGLGVDSRHCDIFEEQEITGDVLLDMDQAFIYMKEYEFGVMGRRLKTWHKIRDFQDDVKGSTSSRQSVATGSGRGGSPEDLTRTHSRVGSNNATALPRLPTANDRPDLPLRQQQDYSAPTEKMSRIAPLQTQSSNTQRTISHNETPPSPWRASIAAVSPSRPSAANVRDISHSRRHSSNGFDPLPSIEISAQTPTPSTPHKKQASLDRDWSMAATLPGTPTSATPPSLRLNTMREQSFYNDSDPSLIPSQSTVDIDRGYFSGGEVDNRKKGNTLRKRDSLVSPVHSRQSSMLQDPRLTSAAVKRHSRLSSVDSIRDFVPSVSTASKAYHSSRFKGRFRSASTRTVSSPQINESVSPVVTNLEDEQASVKSASLSQTSQTNIGRNLTVSDKARRMMGIRAQSEGVPSSEKDLLAPAANVPNTIIESPVQSPTGSSTPSAASKSLEIDNTDVSSKGTAGSILSPQPSNRARPKVKQETSAYTRGLLNISPAEARKMCDYSGWMKKKSSSLITTWKPRLFILRGRRLSYYYSEDDKTEQGIIDISGHKVLVANSDTLVTLHAQVTGATSSPVPGYPSQSTTTKSMESSPPAPRISGGASAPFYFKLVPPKAGISRAVQFTKPTIHIFQVDSLVEGRKWMGEMLKATIEHDLTGFETTNKQKTISLAKAKARKERPPALMEKDEGDQGNVAPEKRAKAGGLQISGLNFGTAPGQEGNSMGLLDEKTNGFDSAGSFVDTGQAPAPA